MNTTARIQSAAGAATILALPLLYIGGVHRILPVTAIGFAIFAIGMLTTPTLRFIPQRAIQEGPRRNARSRPSRGRSARTQAAKDREIQQERVE